LATSGQSKGEQSGEQSGTCHFLYPLTINCKLNLLRQPGFELPGAKNSTSSEKKYHYFYCVQRSSRKNVIKLATCFRAKSINLDHQTAILCPRILLIT